MLCAGSPIDNETTFSVWKAPRYRVSKVRFRHRALSADVLMQCGRECSSAHPPHGCRVQCSNDTYMAIAQTIQEMVANGTLGQAQLLRLGFHTVRPL